MIRFFATVFGVLDAAGAAGLASRYLPIENEVVLVVAAARGLDANAGVIALILFALGQRLILTILAALLRAVMIGVQLPRFIGPEKAGVPSVAVRVVTANLGFGRADPGAVTELALSSADVLVLTELTPEAQPGLSFGGLTTPSASAAQPRSTGVRHRQVEPVSESSIPRTSRAIRMMLRARIQVPGVMFATTILASTSRAAGAAAALLPRRRCPLPGHLARGSPRRRLGRGDVAGDLNSTIDMEAVPQVPCGGLSRRGEQGAGLTRIAA